MSARREAREAAKEAKDAVAAEKVTAKEYVDAALREYKPRKGGTAKWKKGSKVLVPHTDQYYSAVVLQGQKRPDGQWYLLHYEGWSNKYNEWVEEAGVVRFDKSLLEQSAANAGNAPGDLSGRRRKGDIAPVEASLAVEIPQQLRLHIPPLLKKSVLDDSQQINLKGQLLPLPRSAHGRPTVSDILRDYEAALDKERPAEGEEREQKDIQAEEAAREMVRGVRRYFDRCLRHFLLYSHEQQQAEEVLGGAATPPKTERAGAASSPASGSSAPAEARSPCDVYGAEHLVRLFVKLPELVPVAYMTPPDVVRLEQALHDLMSRMTEIKKQARYFSMPEEYQTNPHFNPLMALSYLPLLGGAAGGGGSAAGGGTPAPGGGGTPAPGGAAAGSKGGTPAPETGANSEAEDMEQDGSLLAALQRECMSGVGLPCALHPVGAPHLAAAAAAAAAAASPSTAQQQPPSQNPTSEQAAALAQALRRVALLTQQLEARDRVIGELARSRDDACSQRLASLEAAVRDAHRCAARAVDALAAQRKQYAALVESLVTTVAELEAGDLPPCSCCGGCPGAAAGLAVFNAAGEVAEARARAAHCQEQAADWQLTCSHQDVALSEAAAEIDRLQRCLARQQEATAAAEAALAASQKQQAALLCGGLVLRNDSALSRTLHCIPEGGKQCGEEALARQASTIAACWDPASTAAEATAAAIELPPTAAAATEAVAAAAAAVEMPPPAIASSRHRRSASLVVIC